MFSVSAPDRTEAAEYYFTYIDQVGAGDIRQLMADQATQASAFWRAVTEEQSLHRYAPGKWSIREVLSHLVDTERMFVFRAFWFARELGSELPSFDQEIAARAAAADQRTWSSHVEEFNTVRHATLSFFQHLPEQAWSSRGVASGNPFTVRALAFMCVGHVSHHLRILHERYSTKEGLR